MKPKTVLKLFGNMGGIGGIKLAKSLTKGLKTHGWEVIIAGYDTKNLKEEGVRFVELPKVNRYDHPFSQHVREIIRLTKLYDADIIHCHAPYRELAGLVAAKRTNRPVTTTYIGLHATKKFSKSIPIMFCDKVLQNLSGVIANSEWTKEHIIQTHKVPENQIHVVHEGINLDEFNPDKISQNRKDKIAKKWQKSKVGYNPLILLPASFLELKGHKVAIEAAKIVIEKYKDARFIFAGELYEDEYIREIQKQIKDEQLSQNILMPGQCEDIAAGYAVCDIVISTTTTSETFGYTIVEAQAMKKPIIATKVGATGETMKEEGKHPKGEMTGWRIPPNDPIKLAEVIIRILEMDKSKLDKITERGQKLVTQNFGEQKRDDKHNALYTKLINDHDRLTARA